MHASGMLPSGQATAQSSSPPDHKPAAKPQRILACSPCQSRKIKCDRKSPCGNCIKSGTSCVAAAVQPRKRRFPERALLDRLRQYESLLKENGIPFQSLHSADGEDDEAGDVAEDPESSNASRQTASKDLLKDLYMLSHDGSDTLHNHGRMAAMAKIWDSIFNKNNDYLLIGQRSTSIDLFTFHPQPAVIFRLWQVYLDNVDPLLKVTHGPSLQSRIVDATANLADVPENLEALMFGIYCIAIKSLSDDECRHIFSEPQNIILSKYHLACQEALLNCGYTRTSERDALTATYLYLLSAGQLADPRSLSATLGVLIRVAQRMGIHIEALNTKYPAHEAEMRRRLWWSLVSFDARMAELTDFKTTTLVPGWDCKIPLNVSDSELRVDIKSAPPSSSKPTEAIFAVVRSEIGEFLRHSSFHLEFAYPTMQLLARARPEDLTKLERTLREQWFPSFDEENPLQLMTLCTAKGLLAKYQLITYYFAFPSSSCSPQPIDAQRDEAASFAFTILECDTKIMSSPLTRGYTWLANFYFPAPAYLHLLQELKRRPLGPLAERAWQLMSDNNLARFTDRNASHLLKVFSNIVIEAWEICEAAIVASKRPLTIPPIITRIRELLARDNHLCKGIEINDAPLVPPLDSAFDLPLGTATMPPFSFDPASMPSLSNIESWTGFNDLSGSAPLDNNFWGSMSWGLGERRGW